MPFQQEIQRLRSTVETLSSVMDEAERLEEQKLAVLGFDQDNVLETEIQYRFQQHTTQLETLSAELVQNYPKDVENFQMDGVENDDSALTAFRTGQATLPQFWDLFGE